MQPLWVRVDENRIKLAVFVAAFVTGSAALLTLAFVGVPGTMLGFAAGALEWDPAVYWPRFALVLGAAFGVALAIGVLIVAVQLSNAEDWVRGRFHGRDLRVEERPELFSAVEDMSLAASIVRPGIVVVDAPGVNAFALGTTRSKPTIGVTRAFLKQLDESQQRAVIATLIARITSGDIMFGTALAALMGPLKAIRDSRKGIGEFAGSAADGCAVTDPGCADGFGCAGDGCIDVAGDADFDGGCAAAIGVVLFVVVTLALTYAAVISAAWLVTLWGRLLHRTAYEKADAEGMLLLKDPVPMLSALESAIKTSNEVGTSDPSYDGIFYVSTSGRAGVDARERRRYQRLREVLGTEGLAAREV